MTMHGPESGRIRSVLLARPEITGVAVIVLAWIAVLGSSAATRVAPQPTAMPAMANMPSMASMPGMDMSAHDASLSSAISSGVLPWLVMTVAMMGPAALAGLRYTGLHSLVWRRQRAMAEFGAGYVVLWVAFGTLMLGVLDVYPEVVSWLGLSGLLAAAAAWNVTPQRRKVLQACHRARPLPPHGWRAEWGAFAFGLSQSLPCIGTCWCLMLAMVVAPRDPVIWMGVFSGVIVCERRAKKPERASRLSSLVLAVAAFGSLVMAAL